MQRQDVLRQLAAGFLHQEFIESFLDLRGSRLCLRRGTRFFAENSEQPLPDRISADAASASPIFFRFMFFLLLSTTSVRHR